MTFFHVHVLLFILQTKLILLEICNWILHFLKLCTEECLEKITCNNFCGVSIFILLIVPNLAAVHGNDQIPRSRINFTEYAASAKSWKIPSSRYRVNSCFKKILNSNFLKHLYRTQHTTHLTFATTLNHFSRSCLLFDVSQREKVFHPPSFLQH